MYKAAEDAFKPTESAFCSKCSAWRGELGGEPTPELFISHLCDVFDQVKRVLKTFGTCWINIADSYSNKDLVGIPEMFALEMKSRGWIRRNTIIWHKPNAMPRSVRDRFTEDFEYIFFFTKSKNYYFEQQIEPYSQSYQKEQRAPGYVRQHEYENSKYNKHHFNPTMPKFGGKKHLGYGNPIYSGKEWKLGKGRNKRSVWRIPVGNFKGEHFATFPKALVETPVKAGCPKGGIVLDIFSGAGTSCMVAAQNDRCFIGIELNPKFREMALGRINKVTKTFDSGQASDALEPPADKTIKMAA
jgi:site-specific DNA-methyltransferase (adenine-specific)